MKERKGQIKEMVGGCCVCSDESGWDENPLVYCDGEGCDVAVHQACYGIVSVPLGPWFCRKCESPDKNVRLRCELCPSRSGALKRTDTAGWAHVVCALYIPEVRFGDVATMEPILVSIVPPDRFSKSCCLCETNGRASKAATGACMSCNKPGCRLSFHVTCAQLSGLLCEEQAHSMNNVTYCGYCPHHYAKLKRGHNLKPIPAFKPTGESVTPDTSPEKRPPPPPDSRSERKKKTKWSRSPRPSAHGVPMPSPAFTDSSSSSCLSNAEPDDRRTKEARHRTEDAGRADAEGDKTRRRVDDRVIASPCGDDQALHWSAKEQSSHLLSKDQSSHRSEDRAKDQSSHRSEDRVKDQSSHRSEDRVKDQSSHRSEDRSKDQSSHRSEDRSKDQSSHRSEDLAKDQPFHRSEDRTKDQSSHRSEDHSKDQPSQHSESRAQDQGFHRVKEISSHGLKLSFVPSQTADSTETPLSHSECEAPKSVSASAVTNHSNCPSPAVAAPAWQPVCSGDWRPHLGSADSTVSRCFTSANFTETVVTPSAAVFGAATTPTDQRSPTLAGPQVAEGGVKQEPSETEPPSATPAPLQQAVSDHAPPVITSQASPAGGGVKRAAAGQSAEKEPRKRKPPGRPRRGAVPPTGGAAREVVAAADSATGEDDARSSLSASTATNTPSADCSSPTSTSGSIPPVRANGISAVHMIGNQLNPSSEMAERLGVSLAQEVAEQAGYLESAVGRLVGPPLPGARPQHRQTARAGAACPASLTELLEGQWEQGSQFLLEQSQHFDLASLLSCLHQLRRENQQMEEQMASVAQRRDHLLAVHARLSVPLQTAAPGVVSARATAARHQQHTDSSAISAVVSAADPPVENGVIELGQRATGERGGNAGRSHSARNGSGAVYPSAGVHSVSSGAAAAPADRQQQTTARDQRQTEPPRSGSVGILQAAGAVYPQYHLVSSPPPPPTAER